MVLNKISTQQPTIKLLNLTPADSPTNRNIRTFSGLPLIQYEKNRNNTTKNLNRRNTINNRSFNHKSSKIYCRKYPKTSQQQHDQQHQRPRRVRFILPTSEVDADNNDVVSVSVKAPPTTVVDGRLRTITANTTLSNANCFTSRRSNGSLAQHPPSLTEQHHTKSSTRAFRIYPLELHSKRGTLSPTAQAAPQLEASPGGQNLLRAARDADDHLLRSLLKRALLVGISESDLNAVDSSGRTILSYIASNGSIDLLEQIIHLPNLNPNKADNEGNTPLHFAAQAGQVECLNCMLSRCKGIEVDARNNLGFTPLMKAALQGRNKCAKLLLFAGANPTLRDNGRGFRADQWARFCGRYICADVIEKHARQRLLERSTSYGHWGADNELGAKVIMGKVVPVPPVTAQPQSNGLRSKLKKVFRTSSNSATSGNNCSSPRLVTQLTSAALCVSSPVLPTGPAVPPLVKQLIRPLTVPRLQITLVSNGDITINNNNNNNLNNGIIIKTPPPPTPISRVDENVSPIIKPARTKKKK